VICLKARLRSASYIFQTNFQKRTAFETKTINKLSKQNLKIKKMTSENAGKPKKAKKKNPELDKRKLEAFFAKIQRPGECNKYLKAVIDNQVFNGIHGTKILEKLKDLEIEVEQVDSELPYSIKWVRTIKQRLVTDDGDLIEFNDKFEEENYLMILMLADDFVGCVKANKLLEKMQQAQELNPKKSITLVVFGLKEYCRHHKGAIGMKQTEIKVGTKNLNSKKISNSLYISS
jgi:hypothetical protein